MIAHAHVSVIGGEPERSELGRRPKYAWYASIPPKVLKPPRRQRRVAGRILDVAVPGTRNWESSRVSRGVSAARVKIHAARSVSV